MLDYRVLINEARRRNLEDQTLAQVVRQTIREKPHHDRRDGSDCPAGQRKGMRPCGLALVSQRLPP